MKVLIFLTIFFVIAKAEMARYDNYRVYSVKIENEEQYEAMKYLEEYSDSVILLNSKLLNIFLLQSLF